MSLLYLARSLDRSQFEPLIALIRPNRDLRQMYESDGLEVIDWPGIQTLEHTTAFWSSALRPASLHNIMTTGLRWASSERRTIELVNRVNPDLVHLNSAVLVPSARALHAAKRPFVWHVREYPVDGHFGIRRRQISRAMRRWPNELIFLSEAERNAWVDGTRGCIIPNFVDFSRFDRQLDPEKAREELGLARDQRAILYLGGPSELKGIFVLLKALALARDRVPEIVCLMPGSQYTPSGRVVSRVARRLLPLVGSGTSSQLLVASISRLGLASVCRLMPLSQHVERFLAASEIVLFPAVGAHFARPVIEGAAMARPAIASRFATTEELVEHGRTGVLVPPGNAEALAEAIVGLLQNPASARIMGENAFVRARERYACAQGVSRVADIYESILSSVSS